MFKKLLLIAERIFLLSPVILVFLVIFNFQDTKFLVSRSIILVSIYCLVFLRKSIIRDFKAKSKVLCFGIIMCSYFFLMQFLNEGNSDLPRSMLFVLIYFIMVPKDIFSKDVLFYLASLGCVSSGLLALYEKYWLDVVRVGYLTLNPIPFSYYSGLSLVIIVGLYNAVRTDKVVTLKSVCLIVALLLSVSAVVLSQTRATFLSLVVVSLIYLARFAINKPSMKNIAYVLLLVVFTSALFWQLDSVKLRVSDAFQQVQGFSHDNYSSSTGARVKLWESGMKISQGSLLTGHSKSRVSEYAETTIYKGEMPSYLKRFLVHPNPNFHNQFIQTLVDSGFIGLLLILTFVFLPAITKSGTFGLYVSLYTAICLWFDSIFLYNHVVILYSILIITINIVFNNNKKGEEK